MRRLLIPLLAICALASSCGYKTTGQNDLLPANLKTIAIPAFTNMTLRYRLAERIPSAISREFLSRTRYRIVADPAEADAELRGSIVNFLSAPTIFDQATGRAAGIQVTVVLNMALVEKGTGKVLYQRNNFEVRQRYEISVDQVAFFDESEPALARLSQEVARQVVSSVVEVF
jgi:hypothetical protein